MLSTKVEKPSIQDLWIFYEQSKSAAIRNEIVEYYSYLVKCIALKVVSNYQHFNYFDDIVNEGVIALLDAVEKFDFKKNVKFETYASIRIKGSIIDYIRKQDCFPRRIKKLAKTLHEATTVLSNQLGRNPTDAEMAEFLKMSIKEYEKALLEANSLNIFSFEEMIYEKGLEDENFEPMNTAVFVTPEKSLAQKEFSEVLADNINLLNEKEQLILSLYYKEQLRIKDIANILSVSDSRVSQMHSNALRKLKVKLDEYLK